MNARSTAAWVSRAPEEVERELRAVGTAERAAQEKRYLKSSLEHLGAKVPDVRRVVKGFLSAHPELDHAGVVALAAALWDAPVYERRSSAVEVLVAKRELLDPTDVPLVERMLREAKTWALVDTLATGVVAPLFARHPSLGATLDRWAVDPDFWLRRTALLALLPALRAGGGHVEQHLERFSRYADAMLEEKEFFIRKAIGWILRDTSRRSPERVARWLRPRAARASGLTLREATKYLPAEDRRSLLAARREARS